jgi:hypothetical protein
MFDVYYFEYSVFPISQLYTFPDTTMQNLACIVIHKLNKIASWLAATHQRWLRR